MSFPINYLIYISREAFRFDDKVLRDILRESRDRNTRHSISGILLYNAGNIMQVLEGPEEEVQATFRKIQDDARHKDVVRIADRLIEERNFNSWAMAFRTATPELFKDVDGYLNLDSDFLPAEAAAEHSILFLLKTFLAINPELIEV